MFPCTYQVPTVHILWMSVAAGFVLMRVPSGMIRMLSRRAMASWRSDSTHFKTTISITGRAWFSRGISYATRAGILRPAFRCPAGAILLDSGPVSGRWAISDALGMLPPRMACGLIATGTSVMPELPRIKAVLMA